MTFTDKLPRPTDDEMREIVELARDMHTPEAGTVEYALARGLLHKVEPETADASPPAKERALILATFKTPVGEIEARVQRKPDGVVALAWMTDTHVYGDWTLVREGDGDGIEWMRGGITVAPPSESDLDRNLKNALRNATRAMLAWVTP